ncbi:MAG: hypothetical protein WC302_00815 [Candidatus Paceibacterota bacterium]|jgi:hypothetical protein
MKIGTKSLLFGAHQFFIHPLLVALAWWKLYGFPWDPRLWFAFFLHDIGYWGKADMDGKEGSEHMILGAKIMSRLFDHSNEFKDIYGDDNHADKKYEYLRENGWNFVNIGFYKKERIITMYRKSRKWYHFCLYHSRFFSCLHGVNPSRLGIADKFSLCLEPAWLYLYRIRLSGEIKEYMPLSEDRWAKGEPRFVSKKKGTNAEEQWFYNVQEFCSRWAEMILISDGIDKWTNATNAKERRYEA